jgi:hypothetical protein
LVVLAHLQRRWSLSGREGFGFLSPSRRACEARFSIFREMKRLFSTAPDAKKQRQTEATEVIGRGLSVTGCIRLVLASSVRAARVSNRSVRHLTGPARPVNMAWSSFNEELTGCGGESGHDRPDASSRGGCLLHSNRTRGVTRLVSSAARPVGAS